MLLLNDLPFSNNNSRILVSRFYSWSVIFQRIQGMYLLFTKLSSLLILSLGISICRSFSSKELKYVFLITSLIFGLSVDFVLGFLLQSNVLSSFQKCHINLRFLQKTSNLCLSLALSILWGVGTKLSPFERSNVSDLVKLHLRIINSIFTNQFFLQPIIL